MTHTFTHRARSASLGLVALTGLAFTAEAQATPARQPVARDTALYVPPKQPDAVPRPAGPVVVPGAARPALAPDVPFAVAGPRPAATPPVDPDAPAPLRLMVPEQLSSVAAPAPQEPALQVPSTPLVIVNVTAPPSGSTARCKDGSYISGAPSEARCADKGGLGVVLPEPRQVPSTPRP